MGVFTMGGGWEEEEEVGVTDGVWGASPHAGNQVRQR